MITKTRMPATLVSIAASLIWFSPAVRAGGEPVLGRVLYSFDATIGAASNVKPQTILSGDVLATADDGSALIEFQSGGRVKIMENSSLRFSRVDQRIQVELEDGTVVVEADVSGAPTVAVSTPKYRFEPVQLGASRYLIRLSNDQGTTAAAIKGNILVRTTKTGGSYVLHEGEYAAIDADASGLPAQPSPVTKSASARGGWHVGSLSKGESTALAVGVAARAAAGIAIPLTQKAQPAPASLKRGVSWLRKNRNAASSSPPRRPINPSSRWLYQSFQQTTRPSSELIGMVNARSTNRPEPSVTRIIKPFEPPQVTLVFTRLTFSTVWHARGQPALHL